MGGLRFLLRRRCRPPAVSKIPDFEAAGNAGLAFHLSIPSSRRPAPTPPRIVVTVRKPQPAAVSVAVRGQSRRRRSSQSVFSATCSNLCRLLRSCCPSRESSLLHAAGTAVAFRPSSSPPAPSELSSPSVRARLFPNSDEHSSHQPRPKLSCFYLI